MKNRLFDENGIARTRPPACDKPRPKGRANKRTEKQAREYEVCGKCTKKRCSGTDTCVKKRMKEELKDETETL